MEIIFPIMLRHGKQGKSINDMILIIKKNLPFISARGKAFNVAIFKSMVVFMCTVLKGIFH